jgi:hypothetical protein
MNQSTESVPNKKNEGCLSGYHIAIVFANFLSTFLYLFGSTALISDIPKVPVIVLYLLGALSLAVMAFSIVIWQWKKWGVYGLFISTLMVLVLNIYYEVALPIILTGVLVLAILVLLVFPLWHRFKP